ncbi:DoxX family protein [Dyadobacter luticola]|nr:DoxX family protein [Dyadobacter luticola]
MRHTSNAFQMSAKTTRIIATVLLVIPIIVLSIGGVMKILGAEPEMVMQFLTKAGFGPYITLLGLTELTIAGLLIYPKTNKTGFLLATSYFAGALCLEISGGQPTASVVFLVMLWVSMFLRKREVFV